MISAPFFIYESMVSERIELRSENLQAHDFKARDAFNQMLHYRKYNPECSRHSLSFQTDLYKTLNYVPLQNSYTL
jgi:hypothetical protein